MQMQTNKAVAALGDSSFLPESSLLLRVVTSPFVLLVIKKDHAANIDDAIPRPPTFIAKRVRSPWPPPSHKGLAFLKHVEVEKGEGRVRSGSTIWWGASSLLICHVLKMGHKSGA